MSNTTTEKPVFFIDYTQAVGAWCKHLPYILTDRSHLGGGGTKNVNIRGATYLLNINVIQQYLVNMISEKSGMILP